MKILFKDAGIVVESDDVEAVAAEGPNVVFIFKSGQHVRVPFAGENTARSAVVRFWDAVQDERKIVLD